MYDQRRSRRMPISLDLTVSSLFKQDNVQVQDLGADIEVTDVSRTGIGFISKSVLPVGYYFNAKLNLGTDEQNLYCVVKIIRSREMENGTFSYGCQFVGMASIFSDIFDNLEHKIDGIH